jgi:hypothetical protein
MPSEYEALVAALKLTSTPVAEYGWKTRPEGAYYTVQLDGEAGSMDGDSDKLDRSWEGSLDLFYPKLTDRDDLIEATEEILAEIFGSSWYLNSTQYENGTGLFHVEWVFEALDEPDPEPEPEPTTTSGGDNNAV